MQNKIKIALRSLLKNKTFSAINLFGLSTGAVCCLYILFYVQVQRSYDNHHHEADQLFRLTTTLVFPDQQEPFEMATCSPPIVPALAAEFPEVAVAARVCSPPGVEKNLFRVGDKIIYEKKGYYVDSTFFKVFGYHFIAGDPATALDQPFTVALSDKLARRLFNTTDAVGQTVSIGGSGEEQKFKVTGVYDFSLGNSHLMPEFFMAMNSGNIGEYVRTDDSWAGNNFIYGYLRLRKGADAKALEAKLPEFLNKHGAAQLKELNMHKVLYLQPVPDIHTSAARTAEISPGVSNRFLNVLLLIAGFIQLVACINFMNLTTARSAHRAHEVGIRKAIGATRGSLISQFLSESMVLTLLAVILALPLVQFSLPWLNKITGAEVSLFLSDNWEGLGLVFLLVIATGLVAGSYPAFYLSSFRPINMIRGGLFAGKNRQTTGLLRKSLVVVQFVISIALIIGALIIHFQLDYMLKKDLGFEKNQKVIFPFRTESSQTKLETFRDELMRQPEVTSASAMAVSPGQPVYNDISVYTQGKDMSNSVNIRFTYTDENYLKTLKINLLTGRSLLAGDTAVQENEARIVLNETALKRLNLTPENAIGAMLHSDFRERHFKLTIVGVMQDFNFQTLSEAIDPFMVLPGPPRQLSQVVADVSTDNYEAFFKKAQTLWQRVLPDIPFEYSFLDQDFAKLYESEQTLARIISAFTLIAILVSCLGLFGLSTFTAEQRNKEIGIRKVLGSSVAGIVGLLSRDFLLLVAIAILVAVPLAWWGMHRWLENFAYHIPLTWWIFGLAGMIAIVIAGITVSFQSIRAALANPVKSLRSE